MFLGVEVQHGSSVHKHINTPTHSNPMVNSRGYAGCRQPIPDVMYFKAFKTPHISMANEAAMCNHLFH